MKTIRRLTRVARLLFLVTAGALALAWVDSEKTWRCFDVGKTLVNSNNGRLILIRRSDGIPSWGLWPSGESIDGSMVALLTGPTSHSDGLRPAFEVTAIDFAGGLQKLPSASWMGIDESKRTTIVWIVVPHWLVMTILIAPTCAGPSARRLRKRAGACTRCGYDLRASSDRCPECGATMITRRWWQRTLRRAPSIDG